MKRRGRLERISKPETTQQANPAFDRGVDTLTRRLVRWPGASSRAALLGTAAVGALCFAIGDPAAAAPTPCVISGAVATCSGDQSAGIANGTDFSVPPVTTLNVNNLTKAIAPASGTSGISFNSPTANLTIGSDTGAFGITTGGDNASGIYAGGLRGITLTSTGSITTKGAYAHGILADGVDFVTLTSTGDVSTAGKGARGIFAFSSQDVTVTSTGNITTAGDDARGIVAEANSFGSGVATVTSIGNITTTGAGIFAGGGPVVVVTSTGDITTTGGGAQGIYAYGGKATVTSTGNITTTGVNARGIEVSAHSHNNVYVTSTGSITTTGAGIFAQSEGGRMLVTSTGNITTTDGFSNGIYAGGGSLVMLTSTGNITTKGDFSSGIGAVASLLPVGVPLYGPLTVTSVGDITTAGKAAHGIYAANNSRYGTAASVTSTGSIATTGAGANGIFAQSNGAVTVTSTGDITTMGDNSRGIVALANSSGVATVTSIGNIITGGAGSNGISAQSNGAVTVTSTGDVTATGSDASGMSAQSVGGPIAVTINSGTVSGGTGSGTGVSFIGGTDNTLVNHGTVTALSGLAIAASTGNDAVSNFGTVTGNVDLGTGTNVFDNTAGGLFNSGATVSLGAGNALTNAGTLSPGGAGTVLTTALTGNLVQTATGRLAIDFNMAGGGSADRVNVSGAANLAGTVQLRLLNAQAGVYQQTIVSAAGGVTNSGLSLQALQESPVLHIELVYPNANDVAIRSSINFVTSGLSGNQTSLANGLNGATTAGLGGPILNLLLNGPTSLDGYRSVLNRLSGESATGAQQVTFDAMSQFLGLMLDPSNRGTAAPAGSGVSGYASEGEAGAYASVGRQRTAAEREAYAMVTKARSLDFAARWNVWAAGFGGSQTTDGSATVGSSSTASRIAGGAVGADYLIAPNTVAGFALAGGGTSFSVAGGLGSGRSDLFQAGAYVRHTMGAAYVAAALAYGWQDVTTDRTVTLAGLDQLQARFKANAYSGRLEGGYRFVSPWMGVGITPYAAGQFTTFNLPAYAEAAVIGTDTFALRYGAKDVTASRSELGFRTDKSWALMGTLPGTMLTLRSRFAWAHDYSTDRSVGATFQSLPGASFVVNGAAQSADKALTSLAAELAWRNGFSLAGTFDGEFSGNSSSYAGKAVARYQW
ncbi:autotransporter domain-containing protein [Bradyrhizobium sp. OK095]|uniref:autotransporter outer membrane beta-barrel domain-containing protein n=1 Tax=Bradyrhizobium sp. OK095 TaxID=1882760 RepID=UPI0008B5CD78|nr:autotransporter domain-containing protein [Bradyrhizobium sp. OK095]SEM24676.1 Uncharacterized conserved protein, contains a C-terminal beta-barrel porin domain [Bradyrhizobium sp. OK095]